MFDTAEDGGTDPVSAAALANAIRGEDQAVIEPIRDFAHNPASNAAAQYDSAQHRPLSGGKS